MTTNSTTSSVDVRRVLLPNLVLAASVMLTLVAAYFVSSAAEAKDQIRFDNAVKYVGDTIQDRIEIYLALLRSTRGFFNASDTVTRDKFGAFIAAMRITDRYPGVQGIAYTGRTTTADEAAFVADARAHGVSGFRIWPATDQPEAFPVVFIEPLDRRNEAAIGFDMYSEPVRRSVMNLARDTGVSTMSPRVTLVQEIDEIKQSGFLIYTPVYRRGTPGDTVEQRRENLVGFAYAAFRSSDLFRNTFDEDDLRFVDFRVYDGLGTGPEALLYDSREGRAGDEPSSRTTARMLEMPGRSWTIVYGSRPEFEVGSSRGLTYYTLTVGLLVSILLFLVSRSQVNARADAERAADEVLASREQLRLSEARLRRFVDSNLIGIEILDGSGRLLEANDAFLEIVGYTRDELSVRPLGWDRIKPPHRRDADLAALAESTAKGTNVTYETEYLRRDGTTVPVLEGLASVGAPDDTAVGFTLDLSERKRVESERLALLDREREARQLAEEANRLKDDFLATVSHELRTPLNAILGWARLLATGRLDEPTSASALETIERNARSQAQLIEDLLDVSRIMSGKLRLNVEPLDLVPVIELALDSVGPAASAKGIQIVTSLDPATGTVTGDRNRLQQVVWNLLANAVKFTPRGGRVDVRLTAADTYANIEVADSGSGIDAAFLPYVFERFRQADSSITRAHGGLGLGLAIVRHLAEMHGGSVAATSEGEGKGATFIVRIPLMGVRLDEVAARPQARPELSLEGVRVLVVDDDLDSREVIAVALEQYGAAVLRCGTAREALDELDGWEPDVLVSDIAMPEMDGHELVRRIRARGAESGGDLPAIALTAYSRGEDRRHALGAGFQAHMAKPFEPAKLAAAVAELVTRARR